MSEATSEVTEKLQKFSTEPSAGGLDELWAAIEQLAQQRHPALTKEAAFALEIKRNQKFDALTQKYQELHKAFHGIA